MNALTALRAEAVAFADLASATQAATDRLVTRIVTNGAALYVRERDLPKLLGASWQLMTETEIIENLEKRVGVAAKNLAAGYWTYDVNRHIALRMALAAEHRLSAAA